MGASLKSRSAEENCWFSIRTTPRSRGEDFKTQKSKINEETSHLRNYRNFPRSPRKWRDVFLPVFAPKKRFTRWVSDNHMPFLPRRPGLRPSQPSAAVRKDVLHDDEDQSFPRYGKLFCDFSILWKNIFHTVEKQARFFHTMENIFRNFPHNGKNVSTVWKTSIPGLFSGFLAVRPGLWSGARGAPCEP